MSELALSLMCFVCAYQKWRRRPERHTRLLVGFAWHTRVAHGSLYPRWRNLSNSPVGLLVAV